MALQGRGAFLAMPMVLWILLAALLVYGVAFVLATIKFVPHGRIGIVTTKGGHRYVLGQGLHLILPIGNSVFNVPKGPERMDGEVRNIITRDGWHLTAHLQFNARLVDEPSAVNGGDDWRDTTRDVALRVLRTELENNDATDLRPRPQALDESVAEELNELTARWGVEVDWLRVTIRWAYSVPPAHEVPRG